MDGVVTKSVGSWYLVRANEEIVYKCRIRGKFRADDIKSTNPVAVGDKVEFYLEEKKETGIITAIQKRKNYVSRKSVNLSKLKHIIASNIDRVFFMVTINDPPTSTIFIDRFLISVKAYDIPVTILFNKIDSFDKHTEVLKDKLKKIYTKIGYNCIDISAKEGNNVLIVRELIKDKITMFFGHSGVGKSTLVNSLEPSLNLKTSEISKQHKRGQHTTTFTEMHTLSSGGSIIDTPGIRGFGMVDFEKKEIGNYFPEIFEMKKMCKFHNCMHIKEPKCAVKKAIENNRISTSRYLSYLQIMEEENDTFRKDIYKD